MLFIRSLLYFIGSSIVLIIIVTLALIFFFLPLKYRYKITSRWAVFNIWWLKITCKLKIKAIGKKNIPTNPCVIISNHQSTWETLAFQTIFPQQAWVLKKQLLWIPIFGWGLALTAPIVIDRGEKIKALKKVISQGIDRLKKGVFVVIYPEGTRQIYGKIGKYQKGAVAIAKAAKVDLLPVYHNAGRFWAKGSFIKKPGTVVVTIGKSISAENKPANELVKDLQDWTKAQDKKEQNI